MRGDTLASGGKSAMFGGPVGVSQATWDAIWKEEPKVFTAVITLKTSAGCFKKCLRCDLKVDDQGLPDTRCYPQKWIKRFLESGKVRCEHQKGR
jgi:hypothetical protein